jgi:hypothetical protein
MHLVVAPPRVRCGPRAGCVLGCLLQVDPARRASARAALDLPYLKALSLRHGLRLGTDRSQSKGLDAGDIEAKADAGTKDDAKAAADGHNDDYGDFGVSPDRDTLRRLIDREVARI